MKEDSFSWSLFYYWKIYTYVRKNNQKLLTDVLMLEKKQSKKILVT